MTAPLLCIVGPTCTGKTRLAVELARRLSPAELLNADSRQLRRGLRVATCAPTSTELQGVRMHLLDLADPGDAFTVADWLERAVRVLEALRQRAVRPIVVGGTGLYVSALVDGFDFGNAAPDPEQRLRRNELAASPRGLDALVAELQRRDPRSLETIDIRNSRRVVRALEILDASRASLAASRSTTPRPAELIGLDVAPAVHQQWIAARCTAMFLGGAVLDEVIAALERGVSRDAMAASGIGYAEALGVVDGTISTDQAIAATTQRTVRYAKAQRRYFKRDRRIRWLRVDEVSPDELLSSALTLAEATVSA